MLGRGHIAASLDIVVSQTSIFEHGGVPVIGDANGVGRFMDQRPHQLVVTAERIGSKVCNSRDIVSIAIKVDRIVVAWSICPEGDVVTQGVVHSLLEWRRNEDRVS